jgi:hypothetical protein
MVCWWYGISAVHDPIQSAAVTQTRAGAAMGLTPSGHTETTATSAVLQASRRASARPWSLASQEAENGWVSTSMMTHSSDKGRRSTRAAAERLARTAATPPQPPEPTALHICAAASCKKSGTIVQPQYVRSTSNPPFSPAHRVSAVEAAEDEEKQWDVEQATRKGSTDTEHTRLPTRWIEREATKGAREYPCG